MFSIYLRGIEPYRRESREKGGSWSGLPGLCNGALNCANTAEINNVLGRNLKQICHKELLRSVTFIKVVYILLSLVYLRKKVNRFN